MNLDTALPDRPLPPEPDVRPDAPLGPDVSPPPLDVRTGPAPLPGRPSDPAGVIAQGFEAAFERGPEVRRRYDEIAGAAGPGAAADWLAEVPAVRPDVRRALTDVLRSGIGTEGPDPASLHFVDARVAIRPPGIDRQPQEQDARLAIRDHDVTISAKVYLYGSGATQEVADAYERDIESAWGTGAGGKAWRYGGADGETPYNVRFDVDVALYDPENPARTPKAAAGHSNPPNTDNFIEVDEEAARSYVRGGDRGQWRGDGRGGKELADDNPAAHEFGHLLGLPDRYTDGGGAQEGWKGNIMAEPAGRGQVEQRDIDALLRPHVEAYERSKTEPGETFVSYINP